MNKQLFNVTGILGLILLITTTLAGCDPNGAEGDRAIIQEVVDVKLSVSNDLPQQLEIRASGNVSSEGWTSPVLVPIVYFAPPDDGIYEFTFYATPPSAPTASVITPIEVSHRLNPLPEDLKGVRIYAETNEMLVMLEISKPPPVPTPIPAIVNEITKIQLSMLQNQRAQLDIFAAATVISANWSKPTLIAHKYIVAPQDGIYDYTFYATPPAEPGASVITPIEITQRINAIPANLKGIRIHSRTNSIVAMLADPPQPPEPEVINEITEVSLSLLKSFPPKLAINVAGTVTSAGWAKEKLVPHQYLVPPQDGIYEFTYYATPPTEPGATVITPTKLMYTLDPMPDDLLGVRIYSRINNMEAMLTANTPKPNSVLINEITGVQLAILKSNPPQLSIEATGNVISAGWTSSLLVPFQYIQPPQDGIYDFGFYATPPVEPSASVITPIKATHHLASISDNLKGIRIHSQTNTNVALLNQPSPVPAVIYAINDVQITATTDVPAQLELRVIGTVNSGGWSQPTLIPFKYLLPPQDGIYDFTFYATPPANPSGGGFGSIEVIYKLGLVPNDVKGYRVHASTNSIETLLAP